jgi:hypothetical protein
MTDRATPTDSLEAAQEEVLRLRELLIAKDVELGEVKGHLAEMEALLRRLTHIVHTLQARVPWAMRLLKTARRRLRGRRGA